MDAALALPFAGTFAMQLHFDEISRCVAKGAHAALLLDRPGWPGAWNLGNFHSAFFGEFTSGAHAS